MTNTTEATTESQTSPEDIEIWEHTAAGTTYLVLTDPRGKERTVRLAGVGVRQRIRRIDRETIMETYPENNPFTNGRLIQIRNGEAVGEVDGRPNGAKTDQQLLGLLGLGDDFEHALENETEFNVRRLATLTELPETAKVITWAQVQTIRDVISRKWPNMPPPAAMAEWVGDI